jgi:O-antigen ligase
MLNSLSRFASPAITQRTALTAVLLLPLGLLDARTGAEIAIGLTDILFIAHSVRTRNLTWAKQPWFICGAVWWLWVLVCSTPIPALGLGPVGWVNSFAQALAIGRFLIFAAALQFWLLANPSERKLIWFAVALSCLWIGVESWEQFTTGVNIFGEHRWGDGALTGPFFKPRAGGVYAHLLFPALLPAVMWLLERPARWQRGAAVALAVIGISTSVLIGQRTPTALVGVGLVAAALLLPRLRKIAFISVIAAALFLILTPIISPPTHNKLVGETAKNFTHFSLSPYGQIYTRAAVMTVQSPWTGWGFNGFRYLCPEPRFNVPLTILNLPPTQLALAACNLHPHNFYMQAMTDGGFPGLIFFTAFMLACLATLVWGLWRRPDPMRTGLFIGIFTFAWPLVSSDNFLNLPEVGWFFLLLGLGLAASHIPPAQTPSDVTT